MALSREVVEQGLETVHTGWGAPGEFLEKVIEISRYLPKPSDKELEHFGRELILAVRSQVDVKALEQVAPLLPRNPRRLKLLVRYLATLAPLIERFSESELSRPGFYLTQLLRVEFPDEAQRLVADRETMKDLQYGSLRDRHRSNALGGQEPQEKNRPEQKHIKADHPRIERFRELCEAIRQRGFGTWGSYKLDKVFALPDNPPILTYQEVTSAVDRWEAEPPKQRQKRLKDFLSTDGSWDSQRCQAFWHRLMEIRDGHLSLVAGEDLEEQVRRGLKTASEMNRLIEFLAVEHGLFRKRVFSIDEWRELFGVFAKWAHFRKLSYYEELRAEERTLLDRIFEQLTSEDRAALYPSFCSLDQHHDPDPGPAFTELVSQLSRKAAQAAVTLVLQHFSMPNGVGFFWSASYYKDAAKMILFDPNSLLYTDQDNRGAFRALAENAQTQETVQLNFLTFFQQLVSGATQGNAFPFENCRSLLSMSEVLAFVWQAAVIKPLNPRMAGSLRNLRTAVVKNHWASDSDMPIPAQWAKLEEAGFFSTDQNQDDKLDEETT